MRPAASRPLGISAAGLLVATSAAFGLDTLETDTLRLLYVDPTQTYLVPYTARCFENSMEFQRKLWGYTPSERVSVVLSDSSDQGNAAAGYVPRNSLVVELSPLSFSFETIMANEHINWLMNHELVHIATADQAAGDDVFFRKLFQGKVAPSDTNPETILYSWLTTPRQASPRWLREGIAVFVETWMAGGQGRAQGAWDEMVFRAMVKDDAHFYDPLGLASEGTRVDFQAGANIYLYGTRFISYLAYRYSPDHVVRWIARTEGTKKYYASQFERVFGIKLKHAWREWVAFEHEFQQRNLEAIRQYPTTPYTDLSPQALGSVSRAFFDPAERKLYAAFNYPGVVAHIGAISVDDGTIERLVDVKGPVIYDVTSLTRDPESGTLFYTTDNHEYRNLEALDRGAKKPRMLLEAARIGELAFDRSDRSIWGVRHLNGVASVVRVPPPYARWELVRSWPFGEVIYNLDVSPDGTRLAASVGQIDGHQSLKVFDVAALRSGDATAAAEVEFGSSIPSNFVFADDGKLYGSSYYTGVSNVFRFDPATRDLQALTNAETGFFRPIPTAGDEMIVFRYTGQGFVPARITARPLEDLSAITFLGQQVIEKHPELETWNVGSPADIPLESRIKAHGKYHAWKSIGLESVYPVVEGYKDYGAVGGRVNFSDPLSVNRFSFTASYTPSSSLPSDERLHLKALYQRSDWRVYARLNGADFYDLFGPRKTSRKGHVVGASHATTLIHDDPRKLELELFGSYHGDIDNLPRFQDVSVLVDQLYELGGTLSYENMRSSLGAVDAEKGFRGDLFTVGQYVNGDTIPAVGGTFDFGFALPWHHSSIWIRSAAGLAVGDIDDPFANYFFGGFGNNWVDHGPVKRYREPTSFPGVEIAEIGGRTFGKTMLEWTLPPLRFERVGSPGLHLAWLRGALFVGGLETNPGEDAQFRHSLADVGAQADLRFSMLHRMDLTLSLGLARAFEAGQPDRDEFMFSLKILN